MLEANRRLAEAIDAARARGMTIREISESSGLDQTHIHRMRRGANPVTARSAELLWAALGVSPAWLLGMDATGEESPPLVVPERVLIVGQWWLSLPASVQKATRDVAEGLRLLAERRDAGRGPQSADTPNGMIPPAGRTDKDRPRPAESADETKRRSPSPSPSRTR